MKAIDIDEEYIIVKEDGSINGFTSGFATKLGLKNYNMFYSARLRLQDICVKSNQLIRTMNKLRHSRQVKPFMSIQSGQLDSLTDNQLEFIQKSVCLLFMNKNYDKITHEEPPSAHYHVLIEHSQMKSENLFFLKMVLDIHDRQPKDKNSKENEKNKEKSKKSSSSKKQEREQSQPKSTSKKVTFTQQELQTYSENNPLNMNASTIYKFSESPQKRVGDKGDLSSQSSSSDDGDDSNSKLSNNNNDTIALHSIASKSDNTANQFSDIQNIPTLTQENETSQMNKESFLSGIIKRQPIYGTNKSSELLNPNSSNIDTSQMTQNQTDMDQQLKFSSNKDRQDSNSSFKSVLKQSTLGLKQTAKDNSNNNITTNDSNLNIEDSILNTNNSLLVQKRNDRNAGVNSNINNNGVTNNSKISNPIGINKGITNGVADIINNDNKKTNNTFNRNAIEQPKINISGLYEKRRQTTDNSQVRLTVSTTPKNNQNGSGKKSAQRQSLYNPRNSSTKNLFANGSFTQNLKNLGKRSVQFLQKQSSTLNPGGFLNTPLTSSKASNFFGSIGSPFMTNEINVSEKTNTVQIQNELQKFTSGVQSFMKESTGQRASRIEDAIKNPIRNRSLQILTASIIFHIIFALISTIGYMIISSDNFDLMPQLLTVSTANFWRHRWFSIGMNWNANLYDVYIRGLLRGTYDMAPGPDYLYWLFGFNKNQGIRYTNYSNYIWQNVHIFEIENQRQIIAPITTKDYRYDPLNPSTKKQNIYEYGQELSNAVWRIDDFIGKPDSLFTLTNPDFLLTRDGILDDLLISSENIFKIVEEDIKMKLNKILNIILLIVIGVSLIGVIIFLMTFFNERSISLKKIEFADIFFMIRDQQLQEHLDITLTFIEMLEKTEVNKLSINKKSTLNSLGDANMMATAAFAHNRLDTSTLMTEQGRFITLDRSTKRNLMVNGLDDSFGNVPRQGSNNIKKPNLKNLNRQNWVSLCFFLLFQITIIMICIIIISLFLNDRQQILKFSGQITQNYLFFANIGNCFVPLYTYISRDGQFTMRNNPYSEEWQKDYEKLTDSAQFFHSISEGQDEVFRQKVNLLLKGNLCDQFYNGTCEKAENEAKRGLIGINSFMIEAARNIKSTYDASDKSEAAKKVALNLDAFKLVEWIYWYYSPPAVTQLDTLIKEKMNKVIDSLESKNRIVIILFSIFFLLGVPIIWLPIVGRFKHERNELIQMPKIIPISVIVQNNYIKSYIIKQSKSKFNFLVDEFN